MRVTPNRNGDDPADAYYLRRYWSIRGGDPRLQIGIVLIATALTYAGLFLHARHRPAQIA